MKVFAFGDTHFPYNYNLDVIYTEIKYYKPDIIIHVGDLYDQYMFSKYDKEYNEILPDKELKSSKQAACKMWTKIQQISPRSKKFQLLGNHDIRILKQTKRKFPEIYSFIKEIHKDFYSFKGVTTMFSDRDYLEFDNVVYCHGWQTKHVAHFNSSVVRGHSHKAELELVQNNKSNYKLSFELSIGGWGDERQVPLSYPASKKTGWRKAVGVITDGYPQLIVYK